MAADYHRCGEPVGKPVLDEAVLAPWRTKRALSLPDFGPSQHGNALRLPPNRRRKKRPSLTAVHRRVFARDGYACRYCGRACVDPPPFGADGKRPKNLPDERTLDHVVPRSKGGRHTDDNCVVACFACNNEKADATWTPNPI